MLLNNDIEPSCAYCRHGTDLGRSEFACIKRGIVHGYGYCGAFRYEATKRKPPVLPRVDFSKYSDDDFAL